MAVRLTVDFNSGTNGATITAAGSIAQVTGAPIYTTAAAVHGGMGMGVTPATNASTFIRVDLGANPVSHSFSIYWNPKTQSASTATLLRWADSANGNIFSLVQSQTKLIVVDSTSTAQATSTTTWADQVYRIDGQVSFAVNTAPVVVIRLFAVPEGGVATETLSPTLTNPGNLTFARWLIGAVGTGGAASTRSMYFDTFRVADGAEWIGPFVSITGTAAATQGGDTATAVGKLGYSGTAAATQGAQTASAAGRLGYTGTAAATQGAQTATAVGTSAPPIRTGVVAATQGAQTAAAVGVLEYAGAAAATQAPNAASAAGVLQYSGTAATAQSDQTATAHAVTFVPIVGTVAATQGNQTAAAIGTYFDKTVTRPNEGVTTHLVELTPRPFTTITQRP